ncbi:MAG TPA: SUF system NifU family Fe-S cluster assembly protein [Candidatus Acidoferrales bacterium]|nr:SUF system NifU family Fe-S cluster assembly protein [Candidatus Acidoferrales bacterium]
MAIDLYAEEIISHYEHPHNKGKMENASVSLHRDNPTCGDEMTIYLNVGADGKVTDVKFEGTGCAISMASASMMTDFVKGKSLADVEKLGVKELIELLGIDPGPARLKCATLSLRAVKEATFIYEHKEMDSSTKSL